jgi:hypothetical protein
MSPFVTFTLLQICVLGNTQTHSHLLICLNIRGEMSSHPRPFPLGNRVNALVYLLCLLQLEKILVSSIQWLYLKEEKSKDYCSPGSGGGSRRDGPGLQPWLSRPLVLVWPFLLLVEHVALNQQGHALCMSICLTHHQLSGRKGGISSQDTGLEWLIE